MDIEDVLKTYGYTKSQIKSFIKHYNHAKEFGIIYPYYYAMVKINV